ncbi:DNA helicase UvrD, partial [Pseudomonas syringae pv. tagetis]
PPPTHATLTANYPSHQHILAAPDHVVRPAPAIPGKKARASGAHQELLPDKVLERDDHELPERVAEHYKHGEKILQLYRKG